MTTISERLAQAIKDSGLSLREISERSKVPKSAIQRYAKGEIEKIPVDRLQAIAEAIGEDSAYIMGWNVPKKATMQQIKYALGVGNRPRTFDLSEKALSFAKDFDNLDEWGQRFMLQTMEMVSKEHRKP